MVFPNCGPLPQTSQTRAITLKSFQARCRSSNFTGKQRISPTHVGADAFIRPSRAEPTQGPLTSLRRLAHHRLRAMAAAPRVDRNLAQTLRTLLGGRIGWRRILRSEEH